MQPKLDEYLIGTITFGETTYELNKQGKELLIAYKNSNKTLSNKLRLTDFEDWWNAYPANDGFAHWQPRKGLKINKDECYRL